MTSPEIRAADYNFIHNNVKKILGPGIGSFGYGQTVQSSPVAVGNIATREQWNDLRSDIINCKIHQTGLFPPIVNLNTLPVIDDTPADPLVNFTLLADESARFRFSLSPSQSTVTTRGTRTFTSEWTVSLIVEASMIFSTADQARYFFNSGGKIGVAAFRSGGTSSDQNLAWSGILESAGVQYFSADPFKAVNFYTLTNVYQTFYQLRDTAYIDNLIRIQAKCNVADNELGGATQVDIRALYLDSHENIWFDKVDGTFRVDFTEVKASGVLFPSEPSDGGPIGNFSIVSPSYTIGSITSSPTPPASSAPPSDPVADDDVSLSVNILPTGTATGSNVMKSVISTTKLVQQFEITRISGTGAAIFEIIDYDNDLIVKINNVETTAFSFNLDPENTSINVNLQVDPVNATVGSKVIKIRVRTSVDTDLSTITFNVVG